MKKNRILWCIWLAALAALYVAFGKTLVLAALVLSVLLPVASFGLSMACASGIAIEVTAPELLTKSQPGEISVKCIYGALGKMTTAQCILEQHNVLTGESKDCCHQLGDFREEILWNHCGKVESRVSSIRVMDLWGIFAFRKTTDAKGVTDVIPDFFQQEIQTSKAASFDMESVEYSSQKPGEDPSEIFDIREYEYGDSLKRIHWKLTSKYDEIMVMRPSMPIDRSIILYLDLGTEGGSVNAASIDALCEVFTSISRNLIVQEMKHQICLYDEELGGTWVYAIENQEDFAVALGKVLGCTVRNHGKEEDTLFREYMKAPENLPFAHNVICTLGKNWEEDVMGGCCITQIIPDEEYSYYEESAVNKQIKFTKEGYSEELFHIVI